MARDTVDATEVDIADAKDSFHISGAETLFAIQVESRIGQRNSGDVAPDGERFLINGRRTQDALSRPVPSLNCLHELS